MRKSDLFRCGIQTLSAMDPTVIRIRNVEALPSHLLDLIILHAPDCGVRILSDVEVGPCGVWNSDPFDYGSYGCAFS